MMAPQCLENFITVANFTLSPFKGFIVVASCVMTFEARDSAAKVVPARFKLSGSSRNRGPGSRRTTSKQIFRKNNFCQPLYASTFASGIAGIEFIFSFADIFGFMP